MNDPIVDEVRANANKCEHVRIINTRLGLFVPTLITPMESCTEDE